MPARPLMPHPRLERPPVIEALLDLRVHVERPVEVSVLEHLTEAYQDRYPDVSQRGGALARMMDVRYGHRLSNKAGESVTLTFDRFTFGRRYVPSGATYGNWSEFVEAAFAAWQPFRERVAPTALGRIATRFVNQIRVPAGVGFSDVLQQPPSSPLEGQTLAAFSDRRSGRLPGDAYGLHLGRRWEPETSALIVDVEVYRDFPPEEAYPVPVSAVDVKDVLHRIDALKNDLFFGALTETALTPYGHA